VRSPQKPLRILEQTDSNILKTSNRLAGLRFGTLACAGTVAAASEARLLTAFRIEGALASS
jgi:hypothetical protein